MKNRLLLIAVSLPAVFLLTLWLSSQSWAQNDTGIIFGGLYPSGKDDTCSGSFVVKFQQDCSRGRDADKASNSNIDGHAGFSFTKIQGGKCVKDNVTDLMWEVKTTCELNDRNDTYTWYNSNPKINGGSVGDRGDNSNTCYGYRRGVPGTYCNTEDYVARINEAELCGFGDWRMPTTEELRSIINLDTIDPAIDKRYFPNTASEWHWSSSPYAGAAGRAWVVGFGSSYDRIQDKKNSYRVRVVRTSK